MHFGDELGELVALVVLDYFLLKLVRLLQEPGVELEQLGAGHALVGGKVAGVGEQEADGVAYAPVDVAGAREYFFGDGDLAAVIRAGDPEPKHVGAVLLDDLLRRDDVAERFRHLVAILIDGEAMGEHLLVGRLAVDGATDEQGRVEPTAVLIRAFKVQLRWEVQLGAWP